MNNVLPGFTDTARLAELFKARVAKTNKPYEQVLAETVVRALMVQHGIDPIWDRVAAAAVH